MKRFEITATDGASATIFAIDMLTAMKCFAEKYPAAQIFEVIDKGGTIEVFFALPDLGGLMSLDSLVSYAEKCAVGSGA